MEKETSVINALCRGIALRKIASADTLGGLSFDEYERLAGPRLRREIKKGDNTIRELTADQENFVNSMPEGWLRNLQAAGLKNYRQSLRNTYNMPFITDVELERDGDLYGKLPGYLIGGAAGAGLGALIGGKKRRLLGASVGALLGLAGNYARRKSYYGGHINW